MEKNKLVPADYIVVSNSNQLLTHSKGNRFIFDRDEVLEIDHGTPRTFSLDTQTRLLQTQQAELPHDDFSWSGLRDLLGTLSEDEFQLAGRALQVNRWFNHHQYCGRCGRKTQLASDELRLDCRHCELDFYPRIAPCVIGLVTRGDECLLAQHVRHRSGLFSTLAGFIEVGENAEEAFKREVMEEVGIAIHAPEYLCSQSWPFPGQLMIGFTAEYLSGEINIDPTEIVDARWYHYDNLPNTPPAYTISGQLIRRFVASKTRT